MPGIVVKPVALVWDAVGVPHTRVVACGYPIVNKNNAIQMPWTRHFKYGAVTIYGFQFSTIYIIWSE